jgi:hypothetical protein
VKLLMVDSPPLKLAEPHGLQEAEHRHRLARVPGGRLDVPRTIEPTASFWDCGEFLATANKLEVGHPPGAPLFMMLGRVASAFVSPGECARGHQRAECLVQLLHHPVPLLEHHPHGEEAGHARGTDGTHHRQLIAVLGSGWWALAYTWSDSFWFSAVEAEVYSMSSFFTAITFWAILKWESEADESAQHALAHPHLLPARPEHRRAACWGCCAFRPSPWSTTSRSTKTTTKGMIYTFVISAMILGTIQAVIIPGLAKVAGKFELLFVNDLGLPFNTGNLVYAVLLSASPSGG